MSKVIRVEDHTYNSLDQLRVGRQTFDNVINGLLGGRLKILEAMSMLEGILRFREWQREKLERLSRE